MFSLLQIKKRAGRKRPAREVEIWHKLEKI